MSKYIMVRMKRKESEKVSGENDMNGGKNMRRL